MSDKQEEIAKLTKTRNMMLLGALLVGGSTAMKFAGLFSVGAIPPWGSVVLVLVLIGAAVHTSMKLSKLQ